MNYKPLGELLNDEQLKKTCEILNSSNHPPLAPQTIDALKAYYRTIEPELLTKDVLPDYLAYAVAYQFSLRK